MKNGETIRQTVRRMCHEMKRRNFMKQYNLSKNDLHGLLYHDNGSADSTLKVLRALKYKTPECAALHLRELLQKKNFGSLRALSESCGYDRQTIQRWKKGKSSIRWFEFRIMCEALRCPVVNKLPY